MNPILALVVAMDDLIVKNPHYAHCMLLEPGSAEWWLKGCFIYDTADPVAAAVSIAAAVGAAQLLRWMHFGR